MCLVGKDHDLEIFNDEAVAPYVSFTFKSCSAKVFKFNYFTPACPTLLLHILLCCCISYFAPAYPTLLLHILLYSCISYFAPAYLTLLLHILLCSCICYFAPAYPTLLLSTSYFTPACCIVALFFLTFHHSWHY